MSALENFDEAFRDTFGWYTVAKKEFKDSIRSRSVAILALVFTVAFIAPVVQQLYIGGEQSQAAQEFGMQVLLSQIYLNLVTLLLPIVAIFVGYAAISKERSTGSLKLLLSLPHSRKDVLIGKVIGRSGVLSIPLVVSFFLTSTFLALSEFTFKPEPFALFAFFTVIFGVVFVSIVVSISGIFEKSSWAGGVSFVVYMFFTFFWNLIANAIGNAIQNDFGITGAVRWHATLILKLLNPNQAYKTITNSMIFSESGSPAIAARFGMFNISPGFRANQTKINESIEQQRTLCTDVIGGAGNVTQSQFGPPRFSCTGGSDAAVSALYSDPAVVVFMLLWIGIAAAISYYTFNIVDL
jgi:ABC-2 type transport system permease protein